VEFNLREITASKASNMPLDTTTIALAAQKVAKAGERLALGYESISAAGGTVYGLTNTPQSLPKVLTNPTATGWTPEVTLTEILEMKKQLTDLDRFGSYSLFFSREWEYFLDLDYKYSTGTSTTETLIGTTLRQRIANIAGVQSVEVIPLLGGVGGGFEIYLLQNDPANFRINIALGPTPVTVQWDIEGGLAKHWGVIAAYSPEVRHDWKNITGLVKGVAP